MKGTISEMEVATFRERAQAALLQKAQRGALLRRVAIGYVKGAEDRIEKDPDARVRIIARLAKFASKGAASSPRSTQQPHPFAFARVLVDDFNFYVFTFAVALCSAKTCDGLKVHASGCKWRQLLSTRTKEARRVTESVRS